MNIFSCGSPVATDPTGASHRMADILPPEITRLLGASDSLAQETAWAAFLAAYSKLLLHVASSLGGDYDAAMDCYSYILEQLRRDDFHRLRTYAADGRSKFTTWLVVVARRLCLDQHRHRYGRFRGATGSGSTGEEQSARRSLADLVAAEINIVHLPDPSAGDADHDIYVIERRQALEAALAELEPGDRLLLRLRFEDELSAPEIARLREYPTPFHVYRRLNYLFGRLRGALLRSGVEDPVW